MDWKESEYSQRTAFRLARSGALVRIVTADDACEVCKAMAQRTYTPSEVPRLPIRGCLNDRCRCRFVAVDPQSGLTVPEMVEQGIRAFKAGRREEAERLFRRAVSLDDMYEMGWLWLSSVVDDREKAACLEKVLEINPQNRHAQIGLKLLRQKAQATRPSPPRPPDEAPPEPPPPPAPVSLPPEVIEGREERQVIAEQWADFAAIAIEMDPQMVMMQGRAFLSRLERLNSQLVAMVPPEARQEELRLQLQTVEGMGKALAEAIQVHATRRRDSADWRAMQQAIQGLAQQLLDMRNEILTSLAG